MYLDLTWKDTFWLDYWYCDSFGRRKGSIGTFGGSNYAWGSPTRWLPTCYDYSFPIQPYTKKELALLYFPSATPHVAVNHLMSWIRRCKSIHDALVDQGYRKTTMWLSPCEVRLITEYLGEP